MTPREKLDALVELFAPNIQSAFLAAISDVVDNLILSQVISAIEAGDVEGAFRALGFSDAAMRPLTAAIEQAYEQGGVLTGETFPKYMQTSSGRVMFRFNVRNSRAEAWLRDKSSDLITRVQDDARQNIRQTLQRGMIDGRNPRNVALDIVGRVDGTGKRTGGLIGLTGQQGRWVTNVQTSLRDLSEKYFDYELRDKRFDPTVRKAIDSDKPLTADVIEKLTTRYKAAALKYRGEMIGRTEALQSLNASEYEATKQAVVDQGAAKTSAVSREWDSAGDSRVRFSHRRMDGQKVTGFDEAFTAPSGAKMLHPGDGSLGAGADEIIACRCRVRTVIDWAAKFRKQD